MPSQSFMDKHYTDDGKPNDKIEPCNLWRINLLEKYVRDFLKFLY